MKNIGNSILPSSNSDTFKPVDLPCFRVGVVVASKDLDTHAVLIDGGMVCTHPNGHSCKELLNRIAAGEKAVEQFDYILACGGTGIRREFFIELFCN